MERLCQWGYCDQEATEQVEYPSGLLLHACDDCAAVAREEAADLARDCRGTGGGREGCLTWPRRPDGTTGCALHAAYGDPCDAPGCDAPALVDRAEEGMIGHYCARHAR